MSQTSKPPEKDGESSVQKIDVDRLSEQKQPEPRSKDQEARIQEILEELTEGESEPDHSESLPKEERLEEAEQLMAESEPVDLDLSVGELVKVSPELIIERTETGFNSYVVVE